MSTTQRLKLTTSLGESIESSRLLAWNPNDPMERTFVIKLEGHIGQVVEVLPERIYKAWRSSNSKAYCTSNNGLVLTFQDGAWGRERVCQQEVSFRRIWGFSGPTPDEDVVLVYSDESLFVRDGGNWKEIPLPETVGMINDLHGLSASEVYLTTDEGILCFNGEEIEELEGPDGDELMGVLVLSDHEMMATGSELYLWSDDTGWKTLDCPFEPSIAIQDFAGDIYIGSLDGLMRYRKDVIESAADFKCNLLESLGNGLIASGDDVYLFDGNSWERVELPKLARGENPL